MQDIRVGDEVLVRAASGKRQTWMRVWSLGKTGKVGVTPGAWDPISGFAKEQERLFVERGRIMDVRSGTTESKMRTMREVFGRIEEATFRGMGAITDTSAKARADKDAERVVNRKKGYKWKPEKHPGGGGEQIVDMYGIVQGRVRWYDMDDAHPYMDVEADVATPGVRGKPTNLGKFTSVEKAKAAVERELGF